MANDQGLRILRDRQAALSTAFDRDGADHRANLTSRQLVQVYNGGSMPTVGDMVYFTHPVELNGIEIEGGIATTIVDTATTVPVVVLWNAPEAGDILTAHAVGGRWVAERGGTSYPPEYTCGNCSIPRRNLTVSWTNSILGNGATTLFYSGTPTVQWLSECTNQLLYEIVCTQIEVELRVYFFVSGVCPSGQGEYGSTIRSSPYGLIQISVSCSPLLLTSSVTSTSCPNLASIGYTGFTVSQ
jgi:hypothetical protein